MIFKALFKPKWQHDDPQVRLNAIDKLSVSTHHKELTQIAEGDVSTGVRRKALDKLNSLSLWVATCSAKDEQLARIAKQKIKLAIMQQSDLVMPDIEIESFLNQAESTFVEGLLTESIATQYKIIIVKRLNKYRLNFDLALKSTEPALANVCYTLIEDAIETKELERLATKAKNIDIQTLALARLKAQKEAEEAPVLLKKHVNMVLSRLLALKDKNDYEVIKSQQDALIEEWQTLEGQFSILSAEDKQTFVTKYEQIGQKVDNSTQVLKDKYFAEKAERELYERQAQFISSIKTQLDDIEILIQEAVASSGDHNLDQIESKIADAEKRLADNDFDSQEIHMLTAKLSTLSSSAQHLPEFSEQLVQATQLLGQLAQQTLPTSLDELDEKSTIFKEWQTKWHSLTNTLLLSLPLSLSDTHVSLRKQWQDALKPLQHSQSEHINKIKSKSRELNRLITSGKYNAAFGLFKRLNDWNEALTEQNKLKVEREFSKLQDKINELSELREYIAIPRKKELLAETEQLALNPIPEPAAQAQKVKELRQGWRLLGHVNTDEDKQLNDAFNIEIENAFAPCRLFYAEQEKVRDANLESKKLLIDELSALSEQAEQDTPVEAFSELANKVGKLFKRWNEIGPINRDVIKDINKQFFDLYKPLKNKINAFYQQNEHQKQALVNTALQLVEQTDLENIEQLNEASEQLKALQKKWKTIAFSGAGRERKLWQQFREANDQLFNAKQSTFSQLKEQQSTVFSEIQANIRKIEAHLSTTDIKAELLKAQESLHALTLPDALSVGQKSKLTHYIDKVSNQIKHKLSALESNQVKQSYLDLLLTIEAIMLDSNQLDSIEMPARWRNALTAFKSNSAADLTLHNDILIKLELIAGVESPSADKSRRMALQVEMLADKMNQGDLTDFDELLTLWLEAGQPNDTKALERLKLVVNHQF